MLKSRWVRGLGLLPWGKQHRDSMTDAALNTRNASTLCGHRGGNAARGRSAALRLVLLLGLAGTARAGTINVNTTITGVNNDGQCSLTEAIDNANANANAANIPSPAPGVVYPTHNDCSGATAGANTIVLQAGTYTYTAPNQSAESGAASYRFYWYGPDALPAVASTIIIQGNGATFERSSTAGIPAFRFFYVGADPANANTSNYTSPGPGKLTLQHLTLSNGLAQGGSSGLGGGGPGAGGAIFSQGQVTLDRVTLSGNTARAATALASSPMAMAAVVLARSPQAITAAALAVVSLALVRWAALPPVSWAAVVAALPVHQAAGAAPAASAAVVVAASAPLAASAAAAAPSAAVVPTA